MDATDRIVEEFNRLVAIGRDGVAARSLPERIVYYVVATRCEIDIDGFASVYEQDLNPAELELLISGLERIDEADVAAQFRRGFEALKADGFYAHINWNKVSPDVKAEIDAIGEHIGPSLWNLDEKLAALLDDDTAARPAG